MRRPYADRHGPSKSARKASATLRPGVVADATSLTVLHLMLRRRPGVVAFHVPNGEKRDAVTAVKLTRMGVRVTIRAGRRPGTELAIAFRPVVRDLVGVRVEAPRPSSCR